MDLIQADFSGDSLTLSFKIERLDMSNVRMLREQVRSHLAGKPSPVWVDMSSLTYMDSSGMGTLKLLMDDVKTYGGEFILRKVNQPQMMLLKLSKLDSLFQFEEKKPKEGLQDF